MTPEIFAEWLRRQGHRVVHTRSSYWFDAGPRVLQAFPYHWVIQPTEQELLELLREENAIALRYSTPMEAAEGARSYHVVYDRPTYEIKDVDPSVRSKIRRGKEACRVGPISLERYASEGWSVQQDTLRRQHRQFKPGRAGWESMVRAAAGLESFEVWGAEVEGRLAASLMFSRVDDCVHLLYQQSHSDFLPLRVNNALTFEVTRSLVARSGIRLIHYGLHSLDAPASVDEFKLRMAYVAKQVRQRVVFHPWIAPLAGPAAHGLVRNLRRRRPESRTLAKAEGLLRFYLQGKLPLAEQDCPECLVKAPIRAGPAPNIDPPPAA